MLNCPHCQKEFKNQGGLNMHVSLHCKKNPKSKFGSAAGTGELNFKHTCSFRLLNPKNAAEREAINHGYDEICPECEEIK